MLYYFIDPVMSNFIEEVKLKGGKYIGKSDLLDIVRRMSV